jgi:uncharacterized protein (TIGR02246 family)
MRSRYLSLLATAAVVLLPACAKPVAATGTPADEQAIRDLAPKYGEAYSKRDTAALGALMTEDYEDVDPTGTHTQGRAGAEAMAARDFGTMPPGMSMPMTATTVYVRWINANTAVAGGTWTMTGTMPGMPSRGAWMGVAVKKDSTWKMMSTLGAADMTQMMPKSDSMAPSPSMPKKP